MEKEMKVKENKSKETKRSINLFINAQLHHEVLNRLKYWVDLFHESPANTERFYFNDLTSALKFYKKGCEKRQERYGEGTGGFAGAGIRTLIENLRVELHSRGRLIRERTLPGETIYW